MNRHPMILFDLDDTLLNTNKIKQELYQRLARLFFPQNELETSTGKARLLYKKFCESNGGVYEPEKFRGFLKDIFGPNCKIESVFEFNYQPYLLPSAKELFTKAAEQNKVLIWTQGYLPDQQKKLTQTGLITNPDSILDSASLEANLDTLLAKSPVALVDIEKSMKIKERLLYFLNIFPRHKLTYIDNQAHLIKAALEINEHRLKPIWFKNGRQKNEETAKHLWENRNEASLQIAVNLEQIGKHLSLEGRVSHERERG